MKRPPHIKNRHKNGRIVMRPYIKIFLSRSAHRKTARSTS